MIFTRLGRYFAVLALLLGVSQIGLGISLENGWNLPYERLLKDYYEGMSAAEVIDGGIYKFLFGLAFGMLSEISVTLADDN